jgi:hypothetical protein
VFPDSSGLVTLDTTDELGQLGLVQCSHTDPAGLFVTITGSLT